MNLPDIDNFDQSKRPLPIWLALSILILFLFLRPITVSFTHIGNISILDIFGLVSSYLFIFGLLINFKKLRLDITSVLIILFSLHCLTGLALGAEFRDVVRTVVPFLPFFLTKTVVRDETTTALLLKVLACGYFVPIVVSTIMIISGISNTIVTGSMVDRQAGLSSGVHTQGHLMLFFSFLFALHFLSDQQTKLSRWFMLALLFGSLFCAYKTYTRTVLLGAVVFWLCHTFFWKRNLFWYLVVASFILSSIFINDIKSIVTQKNAISLERKSPDLNSASSGRISIWKHNMQLFFHLPLYYQLAGVGLGKELAELPDEAQKRWSGSHNDYMSLLITTGYIGLTLYVLIYASIFRFLLRDNVESKFRFFGISVLLSILIMNFVSNSYIVRFQMAQLFWFIFGLLYSPVFRTHLQRISEGPDALLSKSIYS